MEIVSKPCKRPKDVNAEWGAELVATIKAVAFIGLPASMVGG